MISFRNLVKKLNGKSSDNIYRLILPSFLSMIVSCVCFASSTWAWFAVNMSTATQTLTSANFEVSVTVTDKNNNTVEDISSLANGTYTVTLTKIGNAAKGYCVVYNDKTKLGTAYFDSSGNSLTDDNTEDDTLTDTTQSEEKNSLTFTIKANEDVKLIVESGWGEVPGTMDLNDVVITEGYTFVIGEEKIPVPIEFNFDGIGENIEWNPVVDWEDQMPYADKDYPIYFAASEGYSLGDITVDIDGIVYIVPTGEIENSQESSEQSAVSTVIPENTAESESIPIPESTTISDEETQESPIATIPVFDRETGMLTIPAELLTETTKQLTIKVEAIELEAAPSEDPTVSLESTTTPEESPTPEESLTPEESPTPEINPTPTVPPSDVPSTEQSEEQTATPETSTTPTEETTNEPEVTDAPDAAATEVTPSSEVLESTSASTEASPETTTTTVVQPTTEISSTPNE